MARFSIVLAAAFLLAKNGPYGDAASVAQADSRELSCAAFSAQTSEADLVARFGAQDVVTAPVIGMDDGPTDGTVLFPSRPDSRLEIVWQDKETRRTPAWIAARELAGRWRAQNGITIGTDLRHLERANGGAFRLAGFQTEAQGRVISWGAGRLELATSGACTVAVYLQPRWDGTENVALTRQVRSGREYSSAHPAMQALNPRVVRIVLSYFRNSRAG
jgi:hypothetical protein